MGRGGGGGPRCADARETGFRGWGPRGRAREETGARLGPERPELLLSAPSRPLPSALCSLPARGRGSGGGETRELPALPAAARRPRPAWERRAQRGRSEWRGGVAGQRGAGGDGGDRDGARVCGAAYTRGEDAVAVGGWGAGRGATDPLGGPREPPGTAGWRRPGPGNLAFGGMNGERWERLPTAPCDPIGRRARACVRVCLGLGAAWVLGAAVDRPVAVRVPSCPPCLHGRSGGCRH